jgi:hypothetical protein
VGEDSQQFTMELQCKKGHHDTPIRCIILSIQRSAGVRKVFSFNTEDDPEPLRAIVEDKPYKVSLNPRVLSEYVAEFNAVLDEALRSCVFVPLSRFMANLS